MRREAVLLSTLLITLPASSSAWENKRTHPALTDAARERLEEIDRILRDGYGLSEGMDARLGVQTGFDGEIDSNDLLAGPAPSRYERSQSLFDWLPFGGPPEDVRIRINRCEGGCTAGELERATVPQLLRAGSYAEDNPNVRASHHFHDPERIHDVPAGVPAGNRGLDNTRSGFLGEFREFFALVVTRCCRGGGTFRLFGRSALDRALNLPGSTPASQAEPPNFMALPDAERYLFRAVTAPTELEREHYFALHFLAVGAELHLLQDMASVAHVRNDFLADHVLPAVLGFLPGIGASLERVAGRDEFLDLIQQLRVSDLSRSIPRDVLAASDPALAAPYQQFLPLVDPLAPDPMTAEQFWGRTNTDAIQKGIAQTVNRRFFSRATIDDDTASGRNTAYPSPRRPPSCEDDALGEQNTVGTGSARVWLADLPRRDLRTGRLETATENFFTSDLVPHLARCRYLSKRRPGALRSRDGRWIATVIDESVQRDYLEILLPLAVDYAAKFLDFFFEPRIRVTGAGRTMDGRSRLEIANVSRFDLTARADEVRVFYDDTADGRSSLELECGMSGGEVFTLAARVPGQPPDSIECTMPAALPDDQEPPKSRGKFTVVIRGRHGARGEVVDPSVDWKDGDFVTAVDQVLGWEIAYHRAVVFDADGDGETDQDEERVTDVFLARFDLQAALDGEPVALVETKLTEPLRQQLGLPATTPVDFSSASGEPNGSRLAFGGDRVDDSGTVFFVDPSEFYVVDLADPEIFTQLMTPANVDPVTNFVGGPAWNRDPGVDRIAYSGNQTRDAQNEQFVVQLDPAGGGAIVSADSSDMTVGAAQGGQVAGVKGLLGPGTDVVVGDAASGEITLRFNMDTLVVEPCTEPLCINNDSDDGMIQRGPDFSPDGTRVVFVDFGGTDPGLNEGNLFIGDLMAGTIAELPGLALEGANPAWSHDGDFIAFLGADGFIHVVRPEGGPSAPIPAGGSNPTWLPGILLPE